MVAGWQDYQDYTPDLDLPVVASQTLPLTFSSERHLHILLGDAPVHPGGTVTVTEEAVDRADVGVSIKTSPSVQTRALARVRVCDAGASSAAGKFKQTALVRPLSRLTKLTRSNLICRFWNRTWDPARTSKFAYRSLSIRL